VCEATPGDLQLMMLLQELYQCNSK